MKKQLLQLCGLIGLTMLASCQPKNETEALKPQTSRTVLMYLFQDTNLWGALADNINDLEKGWVPETNGTMLVFVDGSSYYTQFDGKPVLLEICHDTTDRIVSRIVKTYSDVDAASTARFKEAQDDAMRLYPADSYGLIISGHGDGFFVSDIDTKGLTGSDRWGGKALEVDVIANNLNTFYEFIVFDACLMGETTTLYQLRKATNYVVASVELSPGDGFAYSTNLASLYTQPNADLYHFAKGTSTYYQKTEQGKQGIEDTYQTIAVYDVNGMEKLAAVTKKVLDKLNVTYPELKALFTTGIIGQPGLKNSMYYPVDPKYGPVYYYDMNLFTELLKMQGDFQLMQEFKKAIAGVVLYSTGAFSEVFWNNNFAYPRVAAGLSFYIPTTEPEYKRQDEPFYNRFGWSAAAGFTKEREAAQ